MAAIVNGDGDVERSAYLHSACNLGSSHAQRGKNPVNFFDGTRIPLDGESEE